MQLSSKSRGFPRLAKFKSTCKRAEPMYITEAYESKKIKFCFSMYSYKLVKHSFCYGTRQSNTTKYHMKQNKHYKLIDNKY